MPELTVEVRVVVGADHWLDSVVRCPSPNSDTRSDPDDVSLLVVHNISLPAGRFGGERVRQLFTNCLDCSSDPAFADLAGVHVSAHLFIERDGSLTQFVPFDQRAWHAGVSAFRGRARCNDYSIGIELEGCDWLPYEDTQYAALTDVVTALLSRYPRLSLDAVVGHQEIAPARKSDPGPLFDWQRLYRGCYARLRGEAHATHRR
jgi:N-acetyl-anhydromuramoyl-L-alanine amidase